MERRIIQMVLILISYYMTDGFDIYTVFTNALALIAAKILSRSVTERKIVVYSRNGFKQKKLQLSHVVTFAI